MIHTTTENNASALYTENSMWTAACVTLDIGAVKWYFWFLMHHQKWCIPVLYTFLVLTPLPVVFIVTHGILRLFLDKWFIATISGFFCAFSQKLKAKKTQALENSRIFRPKTQCSSGFAQLFSQKLKFCDENSRFLFENRENMTFVAKTDCKKCKMCFLLSYLNFCKNCQ